MATDETLRRQGIVCTQEGKERAEDEQCAGRKEDVPQSYQGRHDAAYGKTGSAEKRRSHACIFSFAFHGQRVGSGKGDACHGEEGEYQCLVYPKAASLRQGCQPCERQPQHAIAADVQCVFHRGQFDRNGRCNGHGYGICPEAQAELHGGKAVMLLHDERSRCDIHEEYSHRESVL